MTTFLSQLDWRFATKSFDTSKKVSDSDLHKILEAIRYAPTSFGLQPFHVSVVTDPSVRARIQESAYGQPQVVDASHLLVFAVRTDIISRIGAYIELASGGAPEVKAGLVEYQQMMHGTLASRSTEEQLAWSARQAYIALGFALAASAELEIDSCPMEGFDTGAVDAILGLSKEFKVVALLPIGYRTLDPDRKKVRFPAEELITFCS